MVQLDNYIIKLTFTQFFDQFSKVIRKKNTDQLAYKQILLFFKKLYLKCW